MAHMSTDTNERIADFMRRMPLAMKQNADIHRDAREAALAERRPVAKAADARFKANRPDAFAAIRR